MAEPDDRPDVGPSTPATNSQQGLAAQPGSRPSPAETKRAHNNPGYATDVNCILYDAAKDGDLRRVKDLLQASPHPDLESRPSEERETALQAAARNNHLDVVKCLISEGGAFDCTCMDAWKRNPLFAATEEGHLDVVKYLVENAANPKDYVNVSDFHKNKDTALHIAARRKDIHLTKYLVEAGADTMLSNLDGQTPASCASAEEGNLEVLQFLLRHTLSGINDRQTFLEWTCLHIAAYHNAGDNVEFLLNQEADPTIRDLEDKTAWQLACERDSLDAMSAFASMELREKETHLREYEKTNSFRHDWWYYVKSNTVRLSPFHCNGDEKH